MSDRQFPSPHFSKYPELAIMLLQLPPARRGAVLQAAVAFRPHDSLDECFAMGPFRAAFAAYWEHIAGQPVPVPALQDMLERPVAIRTVLEFSRFVLVRDLEEMNLALRRLVQFLAGEAR